MKTSPEKSRSNTELFLEIETRNKLLLCLISTQKHHIELQESISDNAQLYGRWQNPPLTITDPQVNE